MINSRICAACRKLRVREEMIRLTVDFRSLAVSLNSLEKRTGKALTHGRSAYLCRSQNCLNNALKGTRLKFSLEGRKPKGAQTKRSIKWPLEAQLIKNMAEECTEP